MSGRTCPIAPPARGYQFGRAAPISGLPARTPFRQGASIVSRSELFRSASLPPQSWSVVRSHRYRQNVLLVRHELHALCASASVPRAARCWRRPWNVPERAAEDRRRPPPRCSSLAAARRLAQHVSDNLVAPSWLGRSGASLQQEQGMAPAGRRGRVATRRCCRELCWPSSCKPGPPARDDK